MARANKNGPTAVDMRAAGITTRQTVMESYTMRMETSMKETGRMIKRTEEGYIRTRMERSITESGKTTNNTALVLKHGQTAPSTKACISKEKRTAEASSPSPTAQSTTANSK